jgi:hypothetical protein
VSNIRFERANSRVLMADAESACRFSSPGKTVKLAPSTVLSLFFAVPNRESDDGHINQVHAPTRFTPGANADCASTSALLATAILVAARWSKDPALDLLISKTRCSERPVLPQDSKSRAYDGGGGMMAVSQEDAHGF